MSEKKPAFFEKTGFDKAGALEKRGSTMLKEAWKHRELKGE